MCKVEKRREMISDSQKTSKLCVSLVGRGWKMGWQEVKWEGLMAAECKMLKSTRRKSWFSSGSV